MARFNRVVAVDISHHVTQRRNARRFILDCDADRALYLKLLRENMDVYRAGLIGYCLMSNHIHLVAVPTDADGLAQALKQTHGRYGLLLEHSSPIKRPRVATTILFLSSRSTAFGKALRYIELNPVRAKLVPAAQLWAWSSAASHCGAIEHDECLALDTRGCQWTATTWQANLAEGEPESTLAIIRQRTHTGRPLGNAKFVQDLEKATKGHLKLQKRGPRENIITERRQSELTFQ